MSETHPKDRKAGRAFPWRDLFWLVVPGAFVVSFWMAPLARFIVTAAALGLFGLYVLSGVRQRRRRSAEGQARPLTPTASIGLTLRFLAIFAAGGLLVASYWMDYRGQAPSTAETLRSIAAVAVLLNFVLQWNVVSRAEDEPRRPD